MGKLVDEVKIWNTPVVGAYLLWRFTKGYIESHPTGDAPVAILHFIAAGILTDTELCDGLSYRQDLASYVRWFNEENKTDLLACLQQQIQQKRQYTMQSIDIAIASGMLAWDIDSAKLFPAAIKAKRGTTTKGVAVQGIGNKAESLGKWFANLDNIQTITSYLGVVL
jgi:hypothetical protein